MTLFVLAVIGMTHIVVESTIMEPVDEWAKAIFHQGASWPI